MKRHLALLTTVLLVVAGCYSAEDGWEVNDRGTPLVWHDDERDVTCWLWQGISCLPDADVRSQ